MSDATPFYITTPIYYVNDAPHIGHAYTTLACDVLARFKRLDGYDVQFLTGTDEHGQKVEKAAAAAGEAAQPFTDRMSGNFRDLAGALRASNDIFIRTTEHRHKLASQAIWKALEAAGDIYLGSYAGWYSVRDEAFFTEAEVTKRQDGARIAPTGAECEWVEEPSYFFRLSEWQDRLLAFYEANPDFIGPQSRRNEVVSFVKGGLQDLSVSRTTFNWGVPVPGDDAHVMYVWLDALTNYITGVGYPETDSRHFSRRLLARRAFTWSARTSCASMRSIGRLSSWPPAWRRPGACIAHGWWTNEGEKISKSLGNVIDPYELIERYGLDQLRYFLLREVPFGNDGDFSHRSMVQRMNGELANDYGNLVQRTLSMIARNCGGKLPEPGQFSPEDKGLLGEVAGLMEPLRSAMDRQAFHEALEDIWRVIRAANAYIAGEEPWALRKSDPERMGTVLFVAAEAIRGLALATLPFMPDASHRILDQLAVEPEARDFAAFGEAATLSPGRALPKPEGVFPRYSGEEA